MSEHTSSSLAVLLRQCANPTGEHNQLARAATPENLKSRLYNMLNEMERQLSSSLWSFAYISVYNFYL